MSSIFSQLGLNTSLDYAKYQAVKGSSGDYVDFLLQYDSAAAEEGDDSWMNNLLGTNDLLSSMSPEMISSMSSNKDFASLFSASSQKESSIGVFDTCGIGFEATACRGFQKRYEDTETNSDVKAAKIAALYTQAANVSIPSRFLG